MKNKLYFIVMLTLQIVTSTISAQQSFEPQVAFEEIKILKNSISEYEEKLKENLSTKDYDRLSFLKQKLSNLKLVQQNYLKKKNDSDTNININENVNKHIFLLQRRINVLEKKAFKF